jgi:hypothetical protein
MKLKLANGNVINTVQSSSVTRGCGSKSILWVKPQENEEKKDSE